METKVATIGIIVEDKKVVNDLNDILCGYDCYIVGRMGVPYEKRGIRIINIIMDAPADVIGCFTGKLSQLQGIQAGIVYA